MGNPAAGPLSRAHPVLHQGEPKQQARLQDGKISHGGAGRTGDPLASLFLAVLSSGATWLEIGFDILTPLLAAVLAIVGGFSQNFSGRRVVRHANRAERLETGARPHLRHSSDQIDAVASWLFWMRWCWTKPELSFTLVGADDNLRPIGNRL